MPEKVIWKIYTDRKGNWRVTTKDNEIPNNSIVREFYSQKEAEKQRIILNNVKDYKK
tara:strand:+ start:7116 stop:7286 length:171 start_codon:yes stop_codon:yes gene_type:complete